MKRISTLALAVTALATTLSAQADVIDAKFSGTVQSQINAGVAVNSPIAGEFIFDTSSASFTMFVIGGKSVAAGFSSLADMTPDKYTALYTAQVSPTTNGGNVNSTFTVDLEALNAGWAAANAVALLTNTAQLATNLDTVNSSFGYYTSNADGSNVKSLTAVLTSLQVTAVPEPATTALWLSGVIVIGAAFKGRRRRDRRTP